MLLLLMLLPMTMPRSICCQVLTPHHHPTVHSTRAQQMFQPANFTSIRVHTTKLNCDALQLKGRLMSRQFFWAVLSKYVLRMSTNCHCPASDQNSDIAIRFSDKSSTIWRSDNFSHCDLDLERL